MIYVVFDSDCGICSFLAEFIEKNKKTINFNTIPALLFDFKKYNIDSKISEITVIYFDNEKKDLFIKIKAIGYILKNMKGFYLFLGVLLSNNIISFLLNPIYDLIANNRAYISSKLKLNKCKIK